MDEGDDQPTHTLLFCQFTPQTLGARLVQELIRMVDLVDLIRKIVKFDLDPGFLRSIAINMVWEYRKLYDEISADELLPPEAKAEQFSLRRGDCAVKAMINAAKEHGVPWGLRRLPCNGQNKLLVKAGRVVLIQEPMLFLGQEPRTADYKRELARSHGLVCQLELDLGDQPGRVLDWSGEVLAVLLHGAAGPSFSEMDRELGGVYLAVPDACYLGWVLRLDLYELAMFEAAAPQRDTTLAEQKQSDLVKIRLRRNRAGTGTE